MLYCHAQEVTFTPPSLGVIKTAVPLLSFQNTGPDAAINFLCHEGDPKKPR